MELAVLVAREAGLGVEGGGSVDVVERVFGRAEGGGEGAVAVGVEVGWDGGGWEGEVG